MAWFNFLKSEGYFDPQNNPEPIPVKNGIHVPYWESLSYLEKLSVQISEGKETEYIKEVLEVIRNVSDNPKDNYRTWYVFIKILANFPNDQIPNDILQYIPIWLGGEYDTMLQTSELCEKLLPKFLNDTPSSNDIEKAEIILKYLFAVEKSVPKNDLTDGKGSSYSTKVYLHFLGTLFEEKNIIPKIVKYCSSDFILELGRTIKFFHLDYPSGINSLIEDGENTYEVKIYVDGKKLTVKTKSNKQESFQGDNTIEDWERKDKGVLKTELVSLLKQENINYTPTEEVGDVFETLYFALTTDHYSMLGFNSIRKLDDKYSNEENLLTVFSIIFRDILNELAKQDYNECIKLLNQFCYDSQYNLPFYVRVALFVVAENWASTKSFFWDNVKEGDPMLLFSKSKYQKELFYLLSKNQKSLTPQEKSVLQEIIEMGKQDKSEDHQEGDDEYWKLGWYAALNEIVPFKEKYLTLSENLKTTKEHYENLGEIIVRSGSTSPISKDDLLKLSNQEIVTYIKKLNPQSRFDEPSVNGLSETLGSAIEEQPEVFSKDIDQYQNLPYIYSYRILNAFGKAWKSQKNFEWKKVLNYCLSTIRHPKFYSGELKIEADSWGASSEWVVGAIANLLTDGLQKDENALNHELLPLVKEIIKIIVDNLDVVEDKDFKDSNMDYPTYSLNSTAGKALRALLDYSLRRARNQFKREDKNKWEEDIKNLFEQTQSNGIIDGYIIQGMYFEQFCFLDYDWIKGQVKSHYKLENEKWLAFMGGFVFGKPPYNKELYEVFYPHYERAIDNNVNFKSHVTSGIVRHITAFYFWNYESLSSEKLLFKFVKQASSEQISELIHFIGIQKGYFQTLSESDQQDFQHMIIDLWTFIVDMYEKPKGEEEERNLGALSDWIVFVSELDEVYTNLILKSCKYAIKSHSTRMLLESLISLKIKGNSIVNAKYIAKILPSLNLQDFYITRHNEDYIKDLVTFLFTHEQKEVAAKFCNKIASTNQQLFLRDIYNKYME